MILYMFAFCMVYAHCVGKKNVEKYMLEFRFDFILLSVCICKTIGLASQA